MPKSICDDRSNKKSEGRAFIISVDRNSMKGGYRHGEVLDVCV